MRAHLPASHGTRPSLLLRSAAAVGLATLAGLGGCDDGACDDASYAALVIRVATVDDVPLSRARVDVVLPDQGTVSRECGEDRLHSCEELAIPGEPGPYQIAVTAEGYAEQHTEVEVDPSGNDCIPQEHYLDFSMEPSP